MPFYRYEKRVPRPKPQGYPAQPITIGEHIKKRRIDLHLLQKDIATLFNVSEETITNWEQGHSVLQVRYYPKLISFLGYYPFPEDSKTIGGKIVKYRYSHGLSHKAMGKLIGVDGSTIASWENNQTKPFPKLQTVLLF